jgi:cyanophycinase-like exopeptidase
MTNPKPVYLLAGGRGSSNEVLFKAVFNEISRPDPLIAYVGAANRDDKGFFKFMGAEIAKAGKCRLHHVILSTKKADPDKTRDILHLADAVFMSGGDVEAGMEILKSKNMLNLFGALYGEGKVFFGASAGSIMLGREWIRWEDPDDESTAELFPCMDIAPLICDTHAEEDGWEELKAALNLKPENTAGYGIPSGACLRVHHNGDLEALGGQVVKYLKEGQGVNKIDALLPVRI